MISRKMPHDKGLLNNKIVLQSIFFPDEKKMVTVFSASLSVTRVAATRDRKSRISVAINEGRITRFPIMFLAKNIHTT